MNDVSNISDTIVAKSDQLNAVDLIGGPIVVTISGVSRAGPDGEISVNYENDNGRPFKPCKTMRRVLVAAWGSDANQWIGNGLQLYNEPTVRWAGKESGGVRISHMSHINGNIVLSLPVTRGKKQQFTINVLQ